MKRLLPILLTAALLAGCDTSLQDESGTLVLEAYLESESLLPPVRVSRTRPVADPDPAPETEATVDLRLNGVVIRYVHSSDPGVYLPAAPFDTVRARVGDEFDLIVRSGSDRADASGTLPPKMPAFSLALQIPDAPIQAILLDSLRLPLDSLQFVLPGRSGYVYPIVASLTWPNADAGWWVALKVEPREPFSSTLLDYFLRPESVSEEGDLRDRGSGEGRWSGVYAVPVDDDRSAVPVHDLLVTVIRGDVEWASFVASSGDPLRREPISNVRGGIGLVVGISVVRQTIRVP